MAKKSDGDLPKKKPARRKPTPAERMATAAEQMATVAERMAAAAEQMATVAERMAMLAERMTVSPMALPQTVGLEALGLDTAGGLRIGGGSIIRGVGGRGTTTIACLDQQNGQDILSILTAGHVVGKAPDTVVTLGGEPGGPPIGVVTKIRGVDAACVRLNTGVEPHDRVEIGGNVRVVRNIATPVAEQDIVFHCGPSARGQLVAGRVLELNAGNVQLATNGLDKKVLNYQVAGMMRIAPISASQFGFAGDSGSPVLKANTSGTFDLVGILVAVDEEGTKNGFALHMADNNGREGIASLMRIEPL